MDHCVQHLCLSICHPHLCHAIHPKQTDIASAGQCKQASAAAVDNCFWRSSTCSAFRCRSWSDSLMLESLWEVFRNHQGSRTSEKELSISGTTLSISTVFYSIPLECSKESWTTVRNIYVSLNMPSSSLSCNPPQTKRHCKCWPVQASFSSCRRQLFSKIFNFFCVPLAFLVRLLNAWLSSFMSGRVWRSPGKTTTKKKPRVPQHYVYSSHPCQSISHATRIKLYISAGKLQQLRWTTAFENLQLLLRSADAPGLTP